MKHLFTLLYIFELLLHLLLCSISPPLVIETSYLTLLVASMCSLCIKIFAHPF